MTDRAARPNIILVEDSDDDAFFFFRSLSKIAPPCCCLRLPDGKAFISYLETDMNNPFLVFLDLKLPLLNGLEVLEWIQGQHLKNALEVVILSGSDHPGDQKRASELGASDYIVKPISERVLSSKIEDWLKKHQQ